MANIFRSLLSVIAHATQKELARQIKYLKMENEILRSKLPERITITQQERQRLLKFGVKLGKAIHALVTIVKPDTFLGWVRQEKRNVKKNKLVTKAGRKKTAEKVRRLILRFARENGWGYTRIMGELKKLGIKPPSRNTVKRILKEKGYAPGPKRGEATWDEFLKRHAKSLWQCDYLAKRIISPTGIRYAFVMIWINLKTRKVLASPVTYNPTQEWSAEQARVTIQQIRSQGLAVSRVQFDRDSKYGKPFRAALKSLKVKRHLNTFRAPNLNAYVERFIQTLQVECLDHFIIFGTRHFDYLVKEFLEHYHHERPHQSLDNCPPAELKKNKLPKNNQTISLSQVRCKERLGGLLKSYSRAA